MDALVNGTSQATVSIFDRGLLYGDGLFETLAVINGRAVAWDWHLERLQSGCETLRIPYPSDSILRSEADRLCHDQQRAVLKIIVTRGAGSHGYLPPVEPVVTRVLYLLPWPAYPPGIHRDGARVCLCRHRLVPDAGLVGIKHLNRLPQVLARNEWRDPHILEGLMFDTSDNLIEGTGSNIFLVESGMLRTPDLSSTGIPGIMRRRILKLAGETGIQYRIGKESLETLRSADEVFLSNSIMGIVPVRQVENSLFETGPVTRRLQDAVGAVV
jgi:4-amino-4-deoxychorismate lyase